MRILVTGGAGFIGSHIVEYFQNKADIVVLDDFRSGYQHNLKDFQCELIKGSILDRTAVQKAVTNVDYIFHLAAMISVPESVSKPGECNAINNEGLLIVLDEAEKAGVKKLCLSSSAAIYRDNPIVPKTEDMLPEPKSPYAITKLSGEHYCAFYNQEKHLETVSLRYFNVFGPRQDPNSAYAAAMPIFIKKALANEPITIYGDGEQTRDFIYVKDVVAANVFVATTQGVTGSYNLGYGKKTSINELAQTIIEKTQSSSKIVHTGERAGDVKHSTACVDKIRSKGFQTTGNLKDGIAETIRFFANEDCIG